MAISITTIPVPYRSGFLSIRRLPSSDFESLASALEKAPLVGGLKELTASVVQQIPSMQRQEIEDILRALFSLSVLVTDEETPLSENLSKLTKAMQSNPSLALSEQEKVEFEKRLARLVTVRTVVLSSKVQRLRTEYPITFHDAIVLTDMRPVFDKAEDKPLGCTISHTLRITYHENGDHKEFFAMLDDDDLESLKKAVQRAEVKASSVKSLLKLANIPDLS